MKKFWRDAVIALLPVGATFLLQALWPAAQAWLSDTITVTRWGIAMLALLPAIAVYLSISWRRNRRPASPRERFIPTDLEDNIIRVLRYADALWLDAEQVEGRLRNEAFHHPLSDIEQALRRLSGLNWVRVAVRAGGNEYTLGDPGLDYARERDYAVMPSEQAHKLRLAKRGARGW